MADRVPVTIRIGGSLPKRHLAPFLQIIADEALTDPLGELFTLAHISGDAPIDLAANDVAWGRLDALEAFCLAHRLPFVRWCGCYPGGWEAERLVFDGTNEPRAYTATDNDIVVATEPEIRSLGSATAILAYFASAALVMPPFAISDGEGDADSGPT